MVLLGGASRHQAARCDRPLPGNEKCELWECCDLVGVSDQFDGLAVLRVARYLPINSEYAIPAEV